MRRGSRERPDQGEAAEETTPAHTLILKFSLQHTEK